MPQQLIYTSAPSGLVAGRSGYCTVARSATMREAVMLRLEQLSYYDHLSLAGGHERPISACRVIDIRGTRYHVLSRIQDAGLDFTGRTNFIAHHLVATPDEVLQMPTPAMVFRKWAGWMTTWKSEARLLNHEDWSGLSALAATKCLPARTWASLTADAVHAYGLLEAKAGTCFGSEDVAEDTLLSLLAESTELLEVRDSRRDFRLAAWQWTFTTSFQEQDNPADFRCRFVPRNHPAFAKLTGSGCVSLPSVRAVKWTEEENQFAQKGWQPAQNISARLSVQRPIQEGESAILEAEANGLPYPAYQWYELEIGTRRAKPLAGATSAKLEVRPHRGVVRYKVEAFNRANVAQRASADVSVEVRAAISATWAPEPRPAAPTMPKAGLVRIDNDEQVVRKKQRNVQKAEVAETLFRKNQERRRTIKLVAVPALMFALFALGLVGWKQGWFLKGKDLGGTIGIPTNPPPAAATTPDNPTLSEAPKTNVPSSKETGMESIVNSSTNTNSAFAQSPPPQAAPKDTNSVAGPIHASLPEPWRAVAIDTRKDLKASSPSNDVYVVTGSGAAFASNKDSLSFVCQKVSSDGEFTASLAGSGKVTSEVTGKSRFGIMMRSSENPESPFVFVGIANTYGLWASRQEKGKPAQEARTSVIPNAYKQICFKLARTNGHFQVSCKYFKDWTLLAAVTAEIRLTNYLVGIVVCSGESDGTVVARFSDVHWKPTQTDDGP